MHTFMDAKLMAKLLRQALAERDMAVTHSESLELVARQFGLANWNILSAKIDVSAGEKLVLPKGWSLGGKSSPLYCGGLDPEQPGTATIFCREELVSALRSDDFATLMQSADAGNYIGQRLRLAAQLRVEAVAGGATLWFRIDGARGTLIFDNLERRRQEGPLAGTTDWITRDVVFDVPEDAKSLHYGFFLKGAGRCWARQFSLTSVDKGTALSANQLPPRPTNLDFGDTAP